MIKKLVAVLAALFFAAATLAAQVNKASLAGLESIKGIGTTLSARIIERKKGEFKDWNDLVPRVKGIGEKSAATFSEGGLGR